ncbi:MAG: type III-B CRISPR module-associated protein Cmr5 [Chloroflexota bacterium]|nr:type III-B CRISPR module-associated protein Cmr5 [Chloroflexota bacterium]
MTRQQRSMAQALRHVQAPRDDPGAGEAAAFGGLCHRFPILLRTNGLMQTLVFVDQKRGGQGGRQQAYDRLLAGIAESVQGEGSDPRRLLETVQGMSLREYMHATRVLLDTWVYYKRFAESILNVRSDHGEEA